MNPNPFPPAAVAAAALLIFDVALALALRLFSFPFLPELGLMGMIVNAVTAPIFDSSVLISASDVLAANLVVLGGSAMVC